MSRLGSPSPCHLVTLSPCHGGRDDCHCPPRPIGPASCGEPVPQLLRPQPGRRGLRPVPRAGAVRRRAGAAAGGHRPVPLRRHRPAGRGAGAGQQGGRQDAPAAQRQARRGGRAVATAGDARRVPEGHRLPRVPAVPDHRHAAGRRQAGRRPAARLHRATVGAAAPRGGPAGTHPGRQGGAVPAAGHRPLGPPAGSGEHASRRAGRVAGGHPHRHGHRGADLADAGARRRRAAAGSGVPPGDDPRTPAPTPTTPPASCAAACSAGSPRPC